MAIFGGKYFALSMFINDEIGGYVDGELTEELYQEMLTMGTDYVAVDRSSRTAIFEFMIKHGYTEASDTMDVTEEELNIFWRYDAPNLETIGTEQPSYAQLKNGLSNVVDSEVSASFSKIDAIIDSLEMIDLLFIFMGIIGAYQVGGAGLSGEEV